MGLAWGRNARISAACRAPARAAVAVVVAATAAAAHTAPATRYTCTLADGSTTVVAQDLSASFGRIASHCEAMAVEASPPEPLPVRPREPSGPWSDTWARAYPDRWSPHELKPMGSAYAPMIREAARRYHLDPKLLMAIAQVESHHRADARSRKGALGLMQVMPATGARYGVHQSQNLYDPEVNVDVAARYLNDLLDMFKGSQRLAVAAYNAGEGAVQRYGDKVPPFPETRRYVQVVLALKDRM